MEILRIGKYTVKISLDNVEATEYKLLNRSSVNEDDMRQELERLLETVTKKIDFTYLGRKLFTEIYPSKSGGCEVFISTVNSEESSTVYKTKDSTDLKKSKSPSIYMVETFEMLLKICFRLKEISFDGKSSIYYDEEGKRYYLALENVFTKELKYAFLTEYAKQIKASVFSYLKEHYRCIIKKNGVKALASLAN